MNGGFIDSFAVVEAPLDDVVEAFDLLHLDGAASLIRRGISLLPGSGDAEPAVRSAMVDGMALETSAKLEDLGSQYVDLVTDELLDASIASYAAPRAKRRRSPTTVPDMLTEYVLTLIERDVAFEAGKVARSNQLFRRNHALYKELRLSEAGRAGIWELRHHANRSVRVSAAVDSLPWQREHAVRVLEDLAPQSMTAEICLKQWRAGKLNLDW